MLSPLHDRHLPPLLLLAEVNRIPVPASVTEAIRRDWSNSFSPCDGRTDACRKSVTPMAARSCRSRGDRRTMRRDLWNRGGDLRAIRTSPGPQMAFRPRRSGSWASMAVGGLRSLRPAAPTLDALARSSRMAAMRSCATPGTDDASQMIADIGPLGCPRQQRPWTCRSPERPVLRLRRALPRRSGQRLLHARIRLARLSSAAPPRTTRSSWDGRSQAVRQGRSAGASRPRCGSGSGTRRRSSTLLDAEHDASVAAPIRLFTVAAILFGEPSSGRRRRPVGPSRASASDLTLSIRAAQVALGHRPWVALSGDSTRRAWVGPFARPRPPR